MRHVDLGGHEHRLAHRRPAGLQEVRGAAHQQRPAVLPAEGAGFWALVSMGAILGGTMRSPFTGVIFVLELTHDVNMLLPLLVAVTLAHGFTVLFLRRSILTEKVARRGYHVMREYGVDPLTMVRVGEVMDKNPPLIPAKMLLSELSDRIARAEQEVSRHEGLFLVDD